MAALLANLVSHASQAARVALPQQLISAQIWSPALARAVLAQSRGAAKTGETALDKILAAIESADDDALSTPEAETANLGPKSPSASSGFSAKSTQNSANSPNLASSAANANAKMAAIAATPRIPALKTWLEHAGVLEGADGSRRPFTLRLSVPTLWAQAQNTLMAALGELGSSGGGSAGASAQIGLPTGLSTGAEGAALRWAGDVRGLGASLQVGVILQSAPPPGASPNVAAQMQLLRTSALLEIEFGTPSAASAAQTQALAATHAGAQTLAAHASAAMGADPTREHDGWLHMAQLYAAGLAPRPNTDGHSTASLCNMAGCQYEGRAICAQPFCAQMNYLWSVAAPQSRT